MAFEATTDGEKIIQLDGKIDKLDSKVDITNENLERLLTAIERLETTRIKDVEQRVTNLEKVNSAWTGAFKLISIIGLVVTIAAGFVKIIWK